MQTYLRQDSETGRLMLVMADYWQGQHEATSYDVVSADGDPIRRRPELDGTTVYGSAHAGWYVRTPHGAHVPVWTLPGQVATAVRTACPRATNRRRKCALCAATGSEW